MSFKKLFGEKVKIMPVPTPNTLRTFEDEMLRAIKSGDVKAMDSLFGSVKSNALLDKAIGINTSAMSAAQIASMTNQAAAHSHTINQSYYTGEPDSGTEGLLRMLGMRLRVAPGVKFCDMIHPHKSGNKVFVFLVHDGNPTYMEDDWDMFPSDALITKLRLLVG